MDKVTRRKFLRYTGLIGLGTLAACATPTPETVTIEKVITQVVEGETIEKVVTQIVEATAQPPAVAKPAGPSLLPVEMPREEMFVADQVFRYGVSGNYNLHIPTANTPHRHGLMMETFYYRDQETGERLYGVAKSDPIYNEDFTTMQVDLRDNIYWSDGTQFTADDVVYTIETTKSNSQLSWTADMNLWVDKIEKLNDFSVKFTLLNPNPRFHSLFEARWNGVYMMPKHVFEKVEGDLGAFTFPEPVVLGAYRPIQFDPQGFWELFERREDWDRTPAGLTIGSEGPKYVLTIFYGDSTKKAIAMSRHELDVFMDADIEAFKSVIESTPTFRSWYKEFPWAYPNEVDSRHISFNLDDKYLGQKEIRWALNLALDVVEMQTTYIGGVAKVTVIPVAPTNSLMKLYHDTLEDWLVSLELDVDGEKYKPYDPTIPDQISAWAKEQGYNVQGEPRAVFGTGWWKYAPEVAEKLLVKNGFKRDNNGTWLTPEGEVWTLDVQSPPDEGDAFRMANAAVDQWKKFGINVTLMGLERSVFDQNVRMGQYKMYTPWNSWSLASGDAWPQIQSLRSDRYAPTGEDISITGGHGMRIKDTKIDAFMKEMEAVSPDSEENFAITREFLKYWVEQAFFVTQLGFKKFVTWDEQYWTGFPTSENPIYQPLYWFHGGKFTFQVIKPNK